MTTPMRFQFSLATLLVCLTVLGVIVHAGTRFNFMA